MKELTDSVVDVIGSRPSYLLFEQRRYQLWSKHI